jgi:hypothetical protein
MQLKFSSLAILWPALPMGKKILVRDSLSKAWKSLLTQSKASISGNEPNTKHPLGQSLYHLTGEALQTCVRNPL